MGKEKLLQAYEEAYCLLENCTPLRFNCGKLCNAICCQSQHGEDGMFLFPFEEERYKNQTQFKIIDSNWTLSNGRIIKLLVCKGQCKRNMRPLACRIFPLAPLLTNNDMLRIKMDIRGRRVCPLCQEGITSVQPVFRQTVRRAITPLLKFDEVKLFIKELTAMNEEIERFFI